MGMDATARRTDSNVYVLDTLANRLDPLTNQARECLRQQAAAIATLSMRIDESFARAVRVLFSCRGHVVISGLGKSGLVGRKIASTLASTGTPSFFVHSAEAMHGDLGMITDDDVVVLISYSGETEEVTRMLPHLRSRGVPTIALVGKTDSSLGQHVDVALDVSVDRETCPHNLAPTSSTLATLAMGDTLAVSLMKLRDFHAEEFARLHPGGSLGKRLTRVADAVERESVTVLSPDTTVQEALMSLASSVLPIALVCEGSTLVGTFRSDDLRRAGDVSMKAPVSQVMDSKPRVTEPGVLIRDADRLMEREGLEALVVVESSGEVCGVFPRQRG